MRPNSPGGEISTEGSGSGAVAATHDARRDVLPIDSGERAPSRTIPSNHSMSVGTFVDRAFSGTSGGAGAGAAFTFDVGGPSRNTNRDTNGGMNGLVSALKSWRHKYSTPSTNTHVGNAHYSSIITQEECAEDEDDYKIAAGFDISLPPLCLQILRFAAALFLLLILLYDRLRSSQHGCSSDTSLASTSNDGKTLNQDADEVEPQSGFHSTGSLPLFSYRDMIGFIFRLILACVLLRYGPILRQQLDILFDSTNDITCNNIFQGAAAWRCLAAFSWLWKILSGGWQWIFASYLSPRDCGATLSPTASNRSNRTSKHSHMAAIKVLAVLTLLFALLHPDGSTWYILAQLWRAFMESYDIGIDFLSKMRKHASDRPAMALVAFVSVGISTRLAYDARDLLSASIYRLGRRLRASLDSLVGKAAIDEDDVRKTMSSSSSGGKGRRRKKAKIKRSRGRHGGERGLGGGSVTSVVSGNRIRIDSQASYRSSASAVSASSLEEERDLPVKHKSEIRSRLSSTDVSEADTDALPGLVTGSEKEGVVIELSSSNQSMEIPSNFASKTNGRKKEERHGIRKMMSAGEHTLSPKIHKPTKAEKSSMSSNHRPDSRPSHAFGSGTKKAGNKNRPASGRRARVTVNNTKHSAHLSPSVISSIRPVVTKEQYRPSPEANDVYRLKAKGKPTPLFDTARTSFPDSDTAYARPSNAGDTSTDLSSPNLIGESSENTIGKIERYPVPNYGNSYLYSQCDRRYSPGKIELAAFLAQVGLFGTECADLLANVPDVDHLARLTRADFVAYQISEEKLAAIVALLEARRKFSTKVEEKEQQQKNSSIRADTDRFSKTTESQDVNSTLPSSGPPIPVAPLMRPPPGLDPVVSAPLPSTDISMSPAAAPGPIGSARVRPQMPIGGEQQQQPLLSVSSLDPSSTLQSDAIRGQILRTPLISDSARSRCLSGDDVSVFSGGSVSTSDNLALPILSPLPAMSFTGGIDSRPSERVIPDGIEVGEEAAEDERVSDLCQQMVGSILDF